MFKNYCFLFCLFFALLLLKAQEKAKIDNLKKEHFHYDTDLLPASFHKSRRDSLRKLMPDKSMAVFFSAPERLRANDVYYEYHQDPNFYYLSGLKEPNSMLIIFKEEHEFEGQKLNEILFVQERNRFMEMWAGKRLGIEGAESTMDFASIQSNRAFQDLTLPTEDLKEIFFQEPIAMEDLDISNSTTLNGLLEAFMQKVPGEFESADDPLPKMMAALRQQKTEEELVLLRKAIDITCEAQNELMKGIHEGMTEYQTEAIIEYVFKRNGAEYTGFPSIQGSGENSCILHYISNRRPLINGGLLVSDVGAEYHGYTADVTRTIPPNGKFSEEEKLIYELVLKAQDAGIEAAIEGNSFWSPHLEAVNIITKGLQELGIIEDAAEVRKYFMHGTSHYLGLDVHDAGLYGPLKAGQVITVEPGIYIAEGSDCDPKWWNIGVRIEDDILITENAPENLSVKSPRTVAEIEALMTEGEKD